MKIQSRRRILLFQWGGKAYETEDYSCYCRYSDFWMGILACAVFADTGYGEYHGNAGVSMLDMRENTADDFTERVDTDTVRELLTHIRSTPYTESAALRGYSEDSFVRLR